MGRSRVVFEIKKSDTQFNRDKKKRIEKRIKKETDLTLKKKYVDKSIVALQPSNCNNKVQYKDRESANIFLSNNMAYGVGEAYYCTTHNCWHVTYNVSHRRILRALL